MTSTSVNDLKLLKGVTAVIPARNEEPSIGGIIERTKPHCNEIVVVDGHSKDKTIEVAKQHGARVVLDNKKGKGDAIRVGAEAANYDVVVFLDADGSHDPADIPRLVEPIKRGEADLVIGSRGRGGSDELHGDIEKLMRLVGSDLILIGINMRWKQTLTDSQNGFRAIRTDVIRSLGLTENITTIEQEMTMKCLKKGFRVDEVPTHEYARTHGTSTIRLRRVWFRYIYSFLKNLV
ncbi:MAG: glycosyltransferase family 2 protein [Deltaproteobacteria bacterium]